MTDKFVKIDDCLYNINQIRCVSPRYNNKFTVEFIDGDTRIYSKEWTYNQLQKLTRNRTVIKAEPGYIMLRYWEEDSIDHEPIIAWVIDPDGCEFSTMPVTVDGIPDDSHSWAIQKPDGTVIRSGDRYWLSYERWLSETKEEEEKQKRSNTK